MSPYPNENLNYKFHNPYKKKDLNNILINFEQ